MANFVSPYSKAYHVECFVMALFCLAAASCDFPQDFGKEKSSLTVTLPGAGVAAQSRMATPRAVHLPEPVTANMSYTLDFYNSGGSFSIGPIRERVVTVELEPGYWDIAAIAYYGTGTDIVAVDKKPQVEILAGQENFVFFTMNADDFIMPDRADGGSNQAKSIGTGDPSPPLSVTMNTSTVFSAIPGWADGFLYQWYYETGSGSGTPVGSGGSFSGPGTRSLSCMVNNSSEGTFQYYVEITNNYTYTPPEGGAATTGSATRNIYVADIEVVTSSPTSYSVGDPGPGGGIIYYVDLAGFTSNGATCHYLEVGLTNLGPAEWGADGATVAGTTVNIGRGYTNTQTIITALNSLSETGMAAQRARAYTGGGLNDWFLPSQEELILLYKSLLPSLVSGLPASAWSSTQDSAANAWSVYSGGLASDPKYALLEFRPVRAF